jgi:CNH domain
VHYLRSTLCVGCAKGFEVVSLETTERQSLLDQADTSLDFVARKENVRPIHIERLNGEFLLNYSDFSFFVNRNGWRARPDWKIIWEGNPHAFALSYPYILAFEPSFIEIRHIETSELIHVMTGRNVRMLHSSTREVIPAAPVDFVLRAPDQERLVGVGVGRGGVGGVDGVVDDGGGGGAGDDSGHLLTLCKLQILYAYEDEAGEDVIASLDFWSKQAQQ